MFVTKSSLLVLARLAIAGILNANRPECTLGNGADDDPLFDLLKAERQYDDMESDAGRAEWLRFASGFTSGVVLGSLLRLRSSRTGLIARPCGQ